MNSEDNSAQLLRLEGKVDAILVKMTKIDTYQKTHYTKIKEIEEDTEALESRVTKNEHSLAKASGFFSIALIVVTAWIGDIFRKGGP